MQKALALTEKAKSGISRLLPFGKEPLVKDLYRWRSLLTILLLEMLEVRD